jgi:ribosome biogenesis GTPase
MHTSTGDGDPRPGVSSMGTPLADLGWDDEWETALASSATTPLTPGRVSRIDRGAMTVLTETGPQRVRAPRGLAIAVGDWVTIGSDLVAEDLRPVDAVLPRRTVFRRMTEGAGSVEQVVAANIDTVFVVDAVDGRLSTAHLQRYLALVLTSGAVPVVVMTKADLASSEHLHESVEAIHQAAPGVAVVVISAATGHGIDDLAQYLRPGATVALLGLSGAGKSTLANTLAGAPVLATGDVRSDGQGRHVTTHRQLVLIPGRGLIIDTPGMRALSVWGAVEGVRLEFADLEALVAGCAFANCSHRGERGCAINAAIATGQATADRIQSWLKLRDQPEQFDHPAARLQVLTRKRRKAAAKLARRGVRTQTVRSAVTPVSGTDGRPPDRGGPL